MKEIILLDQWGDSSIEWQSDCRKKLNKIIRKFNRWQKDGFDDMKAIELLVRIQNGIEGIGSRNGGSGYREELFKMKHHVLSQTSLEEFVQELISWETW